MNRAAEDYIKTIYILKKKVSCVHSVDVARELGFSKASVSRAVTNLRESKIINVRHDGEIVFTSKGKKVAEAIYEKHLVLSKFLKMVANIDEKTAREDACRMEHCVSDSTYDGIKKYVENNFHICSGSET